MHVELRTVPAATDLQLYVNFVARYTWRFDTPGSSAPTIITCREVCAVCPVGERTLQRERRLGIPTALFHRGRGAPPPSVAVGSPVSLADARLQQSPERNRRLGIPVDGETRSFAGLSCVA